MRSTVAWSVCLCASLAACTQSLFEQPGSVADDARTSDAVFDASVSDADLLQGECKDSCVFDLARDFSDVQGQNGLSFLGDTRSAQGTDYASLELVDDGFEGASVWAESAMLAEMSKGPRVLRCQDSTAAACVGLDEHLLVFPGQQTGALDPTLAITLPATDTYLVQGEVLSPAALASAPGSKLMVSRNARWDIAKVLELNDAAMPEAFAFEVEGLTNDRLLLHFVGGGAMESGFAISLRLIRLSRNSHCQLALNMDTQPILDECSGNPLSIVPNGQATPSTTPSVPGLGTALSIAEGAYVESNAQPDYSGDYSISFWAKLTDNNGVGDPAFVSNHTSGQVGGTVVGFQRIVPQRLFGCVAFGGVGDCAEHITGQSGVDVKEWHFVRFVRDAANKSISLCVDGAKTENGTTILPQRPPPDITAPSGTPLQFGNEDGFAPRFDGVLDDVRIIRRALPCNL